MAVDLLQEQARLRARDLRTNHVGEAVGVDDLNRETLRAELTALELRLVDRLTAAMSSKAEAAVVDELSKRTQALENSRAARDHLASDLIKLERRVTPLERFRFAIPSAAALSAIAAIASAAVVILH